MKIITNALSARRPDWKRKRAVKVMPPRKPGDPNPVLRASMERTFETYTLRTTTNSSRARLDELLVRLPRSVADPVRKYVDELLSPRRRGRPSGDDNRELTIAREVAKVRAAAVTQGRPSEHEIDLRTSRQTPQTFAVDGPNIRSQASGPHRFLGRSMSGRLVANNPPIFRYTNLLAARSCMRIVGAAPN